MLPEVVLAWGVGTRTGKPRAQGPILLPPFRVEPAMPFALRVGNMSCGRGFRSSAKVVEMKVRLE